MKPKRLFNQEILAFSNEENQCTQRKPPHIQGELANSTQKGPRIKPKAVLLTATVPTVPTIEIIKTPLTI